MLAQWIGEVVGQMHQHGITKKTLAEEVGWNPKYLSQVLHGRVNPRGAEEKIRAALNRLIPQKPTATNPTLALIVERKNLVVTCTADLDTVVNALKSGEWIVTDGERTGGGRYLLSLGRVC